LCDGEGNRRSGVALAMRQDSVIYPPYGINGLREMSTPPTTV